MEFFLKFDINIFSMLLLVVLYFTMKIRGEAKGTSSRLFFRLLWMTVFLLFLEIMSWLYDGVRGMNGLNYFLNVLFALTTSTVTGILASYIDYHMFGSYNRIRRRWFYTHTVFATGFLLLVNFFHPIIFSVSPENVYSRGQFMVLLPILNLVMFLYISCLAFRNRKYIHKEIIWVILAYVMMPALAAFIQISVYGVLILWPLMAVMVVLTYIFLETVSTSRDYLTGLYSRHRIDCYLDYLIEQGKPFIFVMIDLDDFKSINDTYGHLGGDLALEEFADSLNSRFKDGKVVGRYAGDEFVLILEGMEVDEVEKGLSCVRDDMEKLYAGGKLDFHVKFSYGCHTRIENEIVRYSDIIHFADMKMYDRKRTNSKIRRPEVNQAL